MSKSGRKLHQDSQRNGKTLIPQTTPSHEKGRGNLWAGIATALFLLTASGCVVGTEETPEEEGNGGSPAEPPGSSTPSTEDEEDEVLASSISTSTDFGSDLQIDIDALERLENDFLRLRISLTNNSTDSIEIGAGLAQGTELRTAGAVSLIDDANQKRYLSQKQGDGSCFCDSLDGAISGGETETLWVIFPGDQGSLERMTVTTPLTPPLLDIPISNISESVEVGNLEDEQILDLTIISDSLEEDQTGRTESGEEVSIILSSDVLFDTNSSNLSDEAQEILEQVAQEIDDATSSAVSVDGYADNTGNDTVNLPLSKERAESVESALSDLITREGVTFDVEGHGSADPIADNTTEEGRERNRRVSVTFEK